MTTQVEITLLGGFEIRVAGAAVPAGSWRRRDAASLVKLLALAPGRRLHREQVLDALWPDVAPDVAAPRLHKAAHFARRATGCADAVVLEGDTVAVFPGRPVTVDAASFEHLATAGALDAALRLYRGDLLPADPYEPWTERDRDRLRLLRLHLLRRGRRWDELAALDPLDEEAHVGLMRRSLAAGRPTAALRQWDRLRLVLAEELGLEPGAEARALRDLALTAGPGAPDAHATEAVAAQPEPARRHHRLRSRTTHRRCDATA